jgi:uncharacterized membrane protein
MEDVQVTRHPLEWGFWQIGRSAWARLAALSAAGKASSAGLAPGRLAASDLRQALIAGYEDFKSCRTDVVFLCVLYPLVGLLLARLAFGTGLVQLAFPLVSGFALVGPVFAAGLYEMSRQREQGRVVTWSTPMQVFASPAIGSILALGAVLFALFGAWLATAELIYQATLGGRVAGSVPVTAAGFLHQLLSTGPGYALIVFGVAAGAVFAVVVLAISVVSFPLLLDRNIGVVAAVRLSVRAVRENQTMMAAWGLVVAGGLTLGSLPFLLGLALVLPLLGHATWHLYRRMFP